MSVYKKLMEARLRLQKSQLKKSGHNKFAGYDYFELGDFLPTVQQIFSDLGLCGTVSFTADAASLTVVDTDKQDDRIVFTSPMGSANLKGCHEVQNIGAVETYQRRYLWVAAMEIVEHDALDSVTGSEAKRGIVTGARDGIGEDLADDWKEYLRDLAARVKEMLSAGNAEAARELIRKDRLDDAQETYLHNQLDAKARRLLKETA